ncbi:MAG: thioesterase, partial [Psychrobacter sp.]
MSKKELHFDNDLFVFETVMRVRHTEIDTGHHLTLESLTALLNEARLRFLYSRGIKEVGGVLKSMLASDVAIIDVK